MVVTQNSFIRRQLFFAREKILSRKFRVLNVYLWSKYILSVNPSPSHQQYLEAWLLDVWLVRLEFVSGDFNRRYYCRQYCTSGGCKDALHEHGILLWQSLTCGSLAAAHEREGENPKTPNRKLNQNETKILQHPSPGRQGVVALYIQY